MVAFTNGLRLASSHAKKSVNAFEYARFECSLVRLLVTRSIAARSVCNISWVVVRFVFMGFSFGFNFIIGWWGVCLLLRATYRQAAPICKPQYLYNRVILLVHVST